LVSASLASNANWPLPAAVAAAVFVVTALGIALDKIGVQQARRKTILGYAMVTIGFSLLYRGIMQVWVGRDVLFTPPFGVLPELRVFGLYFTSQSTWIMLTLVIVSGGLSYLFLRTRIGKAMRAASQSPRAAAW